MVLILKPRPIPKRRPALLTPANWSSPIRSSVPDGVEAWTLSRGEKKRLLSNRRSRKHSRNVILLSKVRCLTWTFSSGNSKRPGRLRRMRHWPHGFCCLGMQGQVQGRTGLYAIIVSSFMPVSVCRDFGPAHVHPWSSSTGPEPMAEVREEYLRLRQERAAASSS